MPLKFLPLDTPGLSAREAKDPILWSSRGDLLQFSPNGDLLIAGVADRVYVYDRSGELQMALPLPARPKDDYRALICNVAVSTESETILASDSGGYLTSWSMKTQKVGLRRKLEYPLFASFFETPLVVPRRFRRTHHITHPVLVGCGGSIIAFRHNRVENLPGPKQREFSPYIDDLAADLTGSLVAVARNLNSIYLYRRESASDAYRLAATHHERTSISRIAFSADSRTLYSASGAGLGFLQVPNVTTDSESHSYLHSERTKESTDDVVDMVALPGGRLITAHKLNDRVGGVGFWNSDGSGRRWSETDNVIRSIAVRSTGHNKSVALRTKAGRVLIAEAEYWLS